MSELFDAQGTVDVGRPGNHGRDKHDELIFFSRELQRLNTVLPNCRHSVIDPNLSRVNGKTAAVRDYVERNRGTIVVIKRKFESDSLQYRASDSAFLRPTEAPAFAGDENKVQQPAGLKHSLKKIAVKLANLFRGKRHRTQANTRKSEGEAS